MRMQRILLMALIMITAICNTYAQHNDKHVIYKQVPRYLNIRDQIKVKNDSPYLIAQMAVTIEDKGKTTLLGTATDVKPDDTKSIVFFDDNMLKKLRTKKLGIKIKGIKANADGEIDETAKNNPSFVTYDFEVILSEEHHDLYLKVVYNGSKTALDF